MNRKEYRKAIDQFSPSSALKTRILGATERTRVRRVRPLAVAVAIALILILTAGVVMAGSAELKQGGLFFFPGERVPHLPPASDEPYVKVTDLGNATATYIRFDGDSMEYRGGLLLASKPTDDSGLLVPASFWEIQNGSLVPIEIEVRRTDIELSYSGYDYRAYFYWYVYNGQLYICNTSTERYLNDSAEVDVSVSAVDTNTVLLELGRNRYRDYRSYYILYDLTTGETVDFLSDLNVPELFEQYQYIEWNSDMSGAVLECGYYIEDMASYYLDLKAQTVMKLDDIVGVSATRCNFIDNGTLQIFEYYEAEDNYRIGAAYSYDLATGRLTKIIENGADLILKGGHRYDLLVERNGNVQIIDLKTGKMKKVEGLTVDGDDIDNARDLFSRCGETRFCYEENEYIENEHASFSSLHGIKRIGLIDCQTGVFTYFDRIGYDETGINEGYLNCLDENTLILEGHSENYSTKVIYIYEFKDPSPGDGLSEQ